jgi:MSHA biogenesis protein MshO
MKPFQHTRGFTLMEVIIVIVITGIIGGIIAMFIKVPVKNYVDTAGRAELTDVADTAVRRMAREIRLAVPNSIRLPADGSLVEFVPTKFGGRYLSADDAFGAAPYLNFSAATLPFTVVGTMPAGRQAIVAGDNIVVYNDGNAPADLWQTTGYSNRAAVASVAGNVVTLAANPFAAQLPSMPHPLHRFMVTRGPVRYACSGGSLLRYENYAFSNAIAASTTLSTTPAILASNVSTCRFGYSANSNVRSALLTITLGLTRTGTTGVETVTLNQQVHVDNTP